MSSLASAATAASDCPANEHSEEACDGLGDSLSCCIGFACNEATGCLYGDGDEGGSDCFAEMKLPTNFHLPDPLGVGTL